MCKNSPPAFAHLSTVATTCLVASALWLGQADSAAAKSTVQASRGSIKLDTYPWWPAVKHPYFRGTDKVNIYPYPMLDNLSRQKEPRTWRTVVLENEYLRVTFLPEIGGKIHEVLDKTTGQQMFYVNHVLKPGLIGQCGAWTSGGVEWNTGPQGHTVSALQPVMVHVLDAGKDGSRSVAVGETERIYGTRWTVVVTLRPGRSFLEERVRIYNPTETIRPYYFWNCTAVPNPPGFRFIYPMTLGCDHGADKFFNWPIDHGKDLSRGTNYQDASSIFAWHCDQDFFGSYDDRADRGVVATANHHQLPGKKAWTWGYGGFGRMHQMDLTDTDGPYNEVQTGPLLTQADVGRLDPGETVEWQEWWYPIHGLGGFTFANRELAANASIEAGQLRLRLLGTGRWSPVEVKVSKDDVALAHQTCRISPQTMVELNFDLAGGAAPVKVDVRAGQQTLATFRVPLDLPLRKPPEKKKSPETVAEFAQAGWSDYLFARFPQAGERFRKALEKDERCVSARAGMAYLKLDSDPAAAIKEAQAALAVDPDSGLARFALAVAEFRSGDETAALDDAWKASLDPATAAAARALAAKLLIRQGDWSGVVAALSGSGPWETDPVCRNRLALALWQTGDSPQALRLARANLEADPLDLFARSLLWLADAETKSQALRSIVSGQIEPLLEMVAQWAELRQEPIASRLLQVFYLPAGDSPMDPRADYWNDYLGNKSAAPITQRNPSPAGPTAVDPTGGVFPHHQQMVPVLRRALELNPNDGRAALLLGHLLFSLGRHDEGRELWKKSAELGAEPAIAYRALGMASLNLDHDPDSARRLLGQAHRLDRTDAIVARDLARVLFQLADKAEDDRKRALIVQVRETLTPALVAGRTRSDFVALLARAHNRLGEFAETARLLDTVRVTVWEGAREVHDLFEEAHLELGKTRLAADDARRALAEFDRALEYPENLATGRLEHAREAHIHYLRGNAFAALGEKQSAVEAWKKAAEEPSSKDARKEEARRKAREALEKAAR